MARQGARVFVAALVMVAGAAASAEAGTIYLIGTNGGQDVSATADYTFGTDSITITLTNTIATTYTADQLLTGFRFTFNDSTTATSLTAADTDNTVDIADSGSFVLGGSADLLNLDTWSMSSNGSVYGLVFNPDAEYGIIGAESGGDYSDANGSITGNAGHNPFVYQSATFTIALSGLGSTTDLDEVTFLFGTDLIPVTHAPIPPAAFGGFGLLGGLAAFRAARRRRRAGK